MDITIITLGKDFPSMAFAMYLQCGIVYMLS